MFDRLLKCFVSELVIAECKMLESSKWLTAFCSVVFDVDIGQKIESVIPSNTLSSKEESDIAFHCFPDSTCQELRTFASIKDSCFFFRIRRKRILYCFVFCRQRYDERLFRSVERRAVVVVSLYPFSSVLRSLCQHLAAAYFSEGIDGMDRVYEQVLSWQDPQFHLPIKLSIAGQTLRSSLPPFSLFPPPAPFSIKSIKHRRSISSLKNGITRSVGSVDLLDPTTSLFNEVDVYQPFQSIVNQLWYLWEITVTNQPLLILAPTPVEGSNAVAALISLISPVPFAADFRPYFTIHDPEFEVLMRSNAVKNFQEMENWDPNLPSLIGVTNLYFIKVLSHWPNILSIGEKRPILTSQNSKTAKTTTFKRFNPKAAFQNFKSKAMGAQVLLSTHIQNLWSHKRSLVKPDFELCKELNFRLNSGGGGGCLLQNSEVLRSYFSSFTSSFLEPFKGYFVPVKALINGSSTLSLEASGLPEFDPNEFLSCICDWPFPNFFRNRFHSLQDIHTLYENFIMSQNFKLWFDRQQKIIAEDLGLAQDRDLTLEVPQGLHEEDNISAALPLASHKDTLSSHEMKVWDCSDEVRLVEEFWRLHSELMNEMQDISTTDEITMINQNALSQTEKEFILVFSSMPKDLRNALLSSPAQINFVKRLQQIPDLKPYIQDLQQHYIY